MIRGLGHMTDKDRPRRLGCIGPAERGRDSLTAAWRYLNCNYKNNRPKIFLLVADDVARSNRKNSRWYPAKIAEDP